MNISVNTRPELVLVVAVAANGVIGAKGGLPWHLPEDLVRVKELTMGKPLIMGRKTYESIGRPLPGRRTVVITRTEPSFPSEVTIVKSFECALTYAEDYANAMGADQIIAFGGARIYEAAIPIAKKIYKTEVNLYPDGDTFFPEYNTDEWREVARSDFTAQNNSFTYSYLQLNRI
tara:strand:- start:263 stop:787 length:525 start_codon:yes stop_codon:yes gene_type:complete